MSQMTGTLNPLDYTIWDILQKLVYEGRCGLFANLKDRQNVIRLSLIHISEPTRPY